MQMVGSKVAQLEARKRLAVEREDYDLAKALKVDIEKLRSAGEAAALSSPLGQQIMQQQQSQQQQSQQQRASGAAAAAARQQQLPAMEASEDPDALQLQHSEAAAAAAAEYDADLDLYTGGGAGPSSSSSNNRGNAGGSYAGQHNAVHTYQAYEDRPAVAKASFVGKTGSPGSEAEAETSLQDLDDEALIRADPSRVSAAAMFGTGGGRSSGASKKALGHAAAGGGAARSSGAGPGSLAAAAAAVPAAGRRAAEECGAEPPDGWPSDLPPPEPLAAVSASDAAPVIDVAGEFVAAAFFSRSWQLRDAAAAWLADLTGNGRLSGGNPERRELARGLVRLAVKGLKDKVPQVYSSCLSLLQVGERSPYRATALLWGCCLSYFHSFM